MSATKVRARRDVEAEVTAKVMEALERGTAPWQQPWTSNGMLPTSVSTGRPYRGINVFLLSLAAFERGYASPYWLTFNQAKERGGSVRKGENGTLVVFWKSWEVRDEGSADPEATVRRFVLRHYVLFNLDQTDGVELPPRFAPPERAEDFDPIVEAEATWEGYVGRPALRHAGDRAYYSPATDGITLPDRAAFSSPAAFYSTLFHEATHSTGHKDRLDRFERNGEPQHFGTERYAREELVAEMGSAMLRALAGVEVEVENSAAYVASWLEALRNDKSLVVKAAAQAQRAVDLILGTQVTHEGGEG
ncbi:MAG: hypothetical protein A2V88_12905 [Elusimicrobia bacterium RBG_16_66_12]|nr:MAG: hypothetical protein A2V88_12905 [Elusimicrobia bacterium RBG_16_66_12]